MDARTARLGLWVLLLASLFALAPTTFPGYWQGLEGFVPVFNVTHGGAVASLATTPDLWRGAGRGAFLLAQPLLLLGLSPVAAVRISFGIALLLGGLGVYVWLSPRFGDRMAGLAGILYVLLPPLLAAAYLRGSLADVWLAALLPLALAGLAAYAEGRSLTAAAIVVLSMLWMWRIQSGLAVAATLVLVVYAAWVERSRLAVLVAGVSGAAGLASLIPLWKLQGPAPVNFADHFLVVGQLLYGEWQTAPSIPGWQDRYPFQLGTAALTFGLLAIWLWTRRVDARRDDRLARLLGFSAVASALLAVLTLNLAAPLWALTGAGRLLTYPWQILLLAGPFLAALGGALPALNPVLARAHLWLILAGVALLSSFPYLQPDYTDFAPPPAPVATMGRRPELVVLAADLVETPVAPAGSISTTLTVTWQLLQPLPFDYSVFFQAVTPSPEGDRVVAQLDTQPFHGAAPATTWTPGKILTDTYTLVVPAAPEGSPPAGDLRYFYGLYDWRDGTRLPVDGGIDDKLIFYGK